MTNSYYNTSGTPATQAAGSSAPIRSEFTAIAAGFALLPTLSGNGSKAVIVNAGGTALTVTTGTLALAGNLATTGAFNTTLVQGASVSLTLPLVSGTLATLAGTETLSNKTLVSPALGTPASGVLTNCTGTAAGLTAGNVTTNANLTGVITSVGNATTITSQTGTGTKFVVDTSPTLVTPTLGVATATSLAIGGATLGSNALAVTGHLLLEGVTSTGATGTGNLVFATAPTVTTLTISSGGAAITGTTTAGVVQLSGGLRVNGSGGGLNASSTGVEYNGGGYWYSAGASNSTYSIINIQQYHSDATGQKIVWAADASQNITTGVSGSTYGITGNTTITGTLNVSGQLTSTVSTGSAPFVVASTTNVANLNASSLSGATFAAPGAIGSGTASTIAATTITASGVVNLSSGLSVGTVIATTGGLSITSARSTFAASSWMFDNNGGGYARAFSYGADSSTNGNFYFSSRRSNDTNEIVVWQSDTSGNIIAATNITAQAATAIPAGGTAGAGLKVSSTANFGVFFGSGAPTLSAAKGSLYLRSDGTTNTTRMYVNTDGSTTWTAVNTVA